MIGFKNYHPAVNFIYFAFVITFSMIYRNPVCLAISVLGSFTYSLILSGRKLMLRKLFIIIPVILGTSLLNPFFSHEGATVIAYFPSGSPFTLESVLYGFAAGILLASVILWFSCFNEVITSDKIVYLSGKLFPSLSLIFSMTLRFVPRFNLQMKKIFYAQKCIGRGPESGNIIQKAKKGISNLSGLVTWALENSVDTADSMKSRGYGLPGRTSFSVYRFNGKNYAVLILVLITGVYVAAGGILGALSFRFFPTVRFENIDLYAVSVFAVYFILCFIPAIIEIKEARRWKALRSKI